MGNNIFDKSMEIVRTFPKSANLGGKDPDHVVELCNEVSNSIPISLQCIVYSMFFMLDG